MIPREWLIDTARRVYRSYGFSPIDTPALEYLEILTGKGSDETDKQLYKFQDHGERWVGMRFDLTVPLARFAAQHIGTAGHALQALSHRHRVARREHAARPLPRVHAVRLRHDRHQALAADIETALVIHDLFQALAIPDFTIHVNNRQVLTGLLERFDLADKSTAILRALDKLAKIGREKVADEMIDGAGATPEQADDVLRLAEIDGSERRRCSSELETLVARQRKGRSGRRQAGRPGWPPSTAAGVVAERRPHRRLRSPAGSTTTPARCSRRFSIACPASAASAPAGATTTWPGCTPRKSCRASAPRWGSIACWRRWKSWQLVQKVRTPAPVFMPFFDAERLHDYLRLAAAIRRAGIGVEFYPEPKKLGAAAQVRRPPRLSPGRDRRRQRMGRRHLPDQGPGHRPKHDRPAGRRAAAVQSDLRPGLSASYVPSPASLVGACRPLGGTLMRACHRRVSRASERRVRDADGQSRESLRGGLRSLSAAARRVPYVAVDEAKRSRWAERHDQEPGLHRFAAGRSFLAGRRQGPAVSLGRAKAVLEKLVDARRPGQPGALGAVVRRAVWRAVRVCL